MHRIRYLSPAAGHSAGQLGGGAKAIVQLTPERALVFECWDERPGEDGRFSVQCADPSRGIWSQTLDVRAMFRMGALQRVAEAAIAVYDALIITR